jgi:hypothetical protein
MRRFVRGAERQGYGERTVCGFPPQVVMYLARHVGGWGATSIGKFCTGS